CARVGGAGEVPADGDVHDDEERVVEHPRVAAGVGRGAALVLVAVDGERDRVRCPVDGEDVEVVGERRPAGQRVRAGQRTAAGVAGAVQAAVVGARFPADVLHDVDLTAAGPADAADVVAEHPEGGPDALAPGQLDTGLEVPVRLGEAPGRGEPGRGVLARAVPATEPARVLL